MTITLENKNKINEILGMVETPFDTNQVLNVRKGSCQKIAFVSESGINAKGKKENLIKLEIAIIRVGIAYENLKVNQNEEFQSQEHKLPYGEWDIPRYYIKHNDKLQLRVYNSTLPNHKTKVYYLLNGEIKTKEWCRENNYLLSESNREKPICYNIKVENIIKFGR